MERVPIEDALTAELGQITRHLRAALPSGHFLRLNEVAFETEHLLESETRTGRHSRKVDFFIYAQAGRAAPELAIEAKPILGAADVRGRYLAEEGIGCFFSTDTPYTQQALAGMLAYTVNIAGQSHRTEIRAAVSALAPVPLSLHDISLSAFGTDAVLCSRHERSALSLDPVAIVHLEMLFQPETTPMS